MIKSILAPSKPWIIKHAIWGFPIRAPAKPSKTRQYSCIFLYWHPAYGTPPNFRNLSACARQPARGPCWGDMGLAGSKILRLCCPILRLCWSILGLCWPTLALCWPSWGLGWPILRPMLTHVEPKDPKIGNSKKTVKRMIFWWSAAYLGAMLAHLGAMLAYLEAIWAHLGAMLAHLGAMLAYLEGNVGPSWGYVGPAWGYLGPSWGYVGPPRGYVDPSRGLSSPMLSHLEPQDPKNGRKRRTAKCKIQCKTQDILATRGLRRVGRRPLSPTERGELPYGNATARVPRPDYQCAAAKLLNFSIELAKVMGLTVFQKHLRCKNWRINDGIYRHTQHTHIYIYTHTHTYIFPY